MTASRPIRSLPLSNTHKIKLSQAGYELVEELTSLRATDLGKELKIPLAQALEILRLARESTGNGSSRERASGPPVRETPAARSGVGRPCSALDLLKLERMQGHVVTFCAKIDEMLGGGVPVGKITEFCGAPGIGKTQLCIQLAVDVTIPSVFCGLEGEALYIDTEGSFIIERVAEVSRATVHHINLVASDNKSKDAADVASRYTLEYVLARIHYFRCHGYLELVALVNTLPGFLSAHKNVKLIVIDSIACHFRHGFQDMSLRNRIMTGLAQNLIRMATESDIAVVLTNQMTTRVGGQSGRGRSELIPALGESWAHVSTIRLILYWEGAERIALLYKSPSHKEAVVPFQITQDGVRDLVGETGCELSQCSIAGSVMTQEMAHMCDEDDYDSDTLYDQALTEYVATADAHAEEIDSNAVPPSKRRRTDGHF